MKKTQTFDKFQQKQQKTTKTNNFQQFKLIKLGISKKLKLAFNKKNRILTKIFLLKHDFNLFEMINYYL